MSRLAGKQLGSKQLIGLISLVILYLVLALAFSQTMHFSRALDEGYHLEYITFINQNGHLPRSYAERAEITRADFPPLYHLLVSTLSAKVSVDAPPDFKFFWDSFRYRAINHQTDSVWTLNTEDFTWPYQGRFLVWQIGRWASILLSLATVVVVYFTLRETPVARIPLAPLVGAALLAFIPRYIVLGSSLNDDNLLGLLAALTFWMLVKVINGPERRWPFAGLGIFLGLSLTVKYSLVLIPLEIVLIMGLLARQPGFGWPWFWRRFGLVGGLTLLCSSWWFGWNLWFLNTIAEDGWFVGLLRPILLGGNDTTLNRIGGFVSGGEAGLTGLPEDTTVGAWAHWAQYIFLSIWGVAFGDATPFGPYAYLLIGLMLALAVFGLAQVWRIGKALNTEFSSRAGSAMPDRIWLALLLLHVGLFWVLPVVRFGLTRRLSVAAQGRHILIPAATAIVALLVWGVAAAVPERWYRPVFATIIVCFVGWTGAHLYRLNTTAVPLLPLRTLPQAAEWLPFSANARFGDTIALVSYDLEPEPEQGRLALELAWRALAQVNESYLLKVELVDAAGTVISHWIGYNGQGRLPTLAWDAGDSIFDRLVLPLPNLPAGPYRVEVQVLSQAGPLLVSQAGEAGGEDEVQVTRLLLAEFSLDSASRFSYSRQIEPSGSPGSEPVKFEVWPPQPESFRGWQSVPQTPLFYYPATILVVIDDQRLPSDLSWQVMLIDTAGHTWSPQEQSLGVYSFVIGPRWQSSQYQVLVAWLEGEQVVSQASSEPVLQVENWWERQFTVPEIPVPVQANFANQLNFLGYKLPQKQVTAGASFPITLYWQAPADRSPQADFVQFNHLLASDGTLYGGYDRHPLEYYNTLLWAPGEVVVDGYVVPVSAEAPPGEYYLDVGYYLTVGESAVNLPLVVDGEMSEVSRVTIGPIQVVRP
ncbi:MAG TPA: glycosyltransferase family 39 protein [Anaerolineae bacterium]